MSGKAYIREMPKTTWWLSHSRYRRYVAREVTCIPIGIYTAVLIWGLMRLSQGALAWEGFLGALNSPLSILFHLVAFVFAIVHTISWFNVTPSAMRVQIGEDFAPGAVIIGVHYAGWVVVSLIVLFMAGV